MNDKHLDIAIRYKQAAGPSAAILQALYKNFGKTIGSGGREIARRAVTGFMPGAGMGAVGGFMMPGTGGKDIMGRDMPVSFGDRLSGALRGGLYGGVLGAVGNAALGGPAARLQAGDMSKLKQVPNSVVKAPAGPVANKTPISPQPAQPAQTPPPTSAGRGQTAPAQQQKAPAQQQKAPAAGNRQYGTDAPLGGVDLKRGVPTNTQPQNQASGNRRLSKNTQEFQDLQAQRRMPVDNSWNWKTPALIAGAFGATGLPLLFKNNNNNKQASGNMAKIAVARYPEKYRAKIAAMGLFQPLGIGLGLAGLGFGAYKLHQENKKTPGGLQLNPFSSIGNAFNSVQNNNAQKGK